MGVKGSVQVPDGKTMKAGREVGLGGAASPPHSGTWLKRYDTDSPLWVLLIASARIMEMSMTCKGGGEEIFTLV